MALFTINHVAVRGIAAGVPHEIVDNNVIFPKFYGASAENFIQTTGVIRKRKAGKDVCTSDLCLAAAEKLIAELGWQKEEIEGLVFVSQGPDYALPATSCILQERLGLPQSCLALDVSLGCSGWVYGMSVLASMMQSGQIKKGLMLCGDTSLKSGSEKDPSTYPLFGDAGTCTALESDPNSPETMTFALHTDGKGYEAIIIPDGGARNPITEASLVEKEFEGGIRRDRVHVAMDGMSVFTFGINKAPKVVRELLEARGEAVEDIDLFGFHQANLFMNEKIRKKLKLTPEQVPYCLDEYGNTSSASIPLTYVSRCKEQLTTKKMKNIGCGFGVGLSWGAVRFDTDHIVVPDVVEV